MNEHDPQVPQTPPVPPADTEPAAAAAAPAVPPHTAPAWWADRKRLAGAVAGVAVVAAVGVGGGYALGHSSSGSDAQVAGRFGNQFPGSGTPGAQGMQGQGMQGQGMQGQMGGMDGEQHVTGTVAEVGADTVTVKTASGATETYQVTSSTQVVLNGSAATLADLKAGSSVLVHVLPEGSGDGTAERVLAGSSATSGGFGPPAGGQPGTTSGSGQSTRTS